MLYLQIVKNTTMAYIILQMVISLMENGIMEYEKEKEFFINKKE